MAIRHAIENYGPIVAFNNIQQFVSYTFQSRALCNLEADVHNTNDISDATLNIRGVYSPRNSILPADIRVIFGQVNLSLRCLASTSAGMAALLEIFKLPESVQSNHIALTARHIENAMQGWGIDLCSPIVYKVAKAQTDLVCVLWKNGEKEFYRATQLQSTQAGQVLLAELGAEGVILIDKGASQKPVPSVLHQAV